MIALDTNILVRYLVRDDEKQAEAARTLLESLTIEQPGFVCREVIVELVWVLERSYKCSRDRIATVLEQLATTESLVVETGNDVIRAASRYRSGVVGFSDLMILSAAERTQAHLLYTFDQKAARLEGVELL
ncbi:MAG: type II toxin-antitoxin system VapC family toxin [Gammaproteobacteria bacterium]|nr:type II toxin-antitoxin system VapC family toxin [Caldilineaceae bacterium]MDE0512687.1 type II toxin-antitoxin system VapC family toxin [Gammaproteobacteria bacterium]